MHSPILGFVQGFTSTACGLCKRSVEKSVQTMSPMPAYARVDVIWNNKSELVVSELELIEPELWFRLNPHAADVLAKYINGLLAKKI